MEKQGKEIISYIFFGALTTLVSIGSFALFDVVMGIDPLIANVFSWILAVLFAYATNRRWVFDSHAKGARATLREMGSFFAGRLLTLGIEELILLVFITWLGWNDLIVKVAAQLIVLISNYLISKFIVFRTRNG